MNDDAPVPEGTLIGNRWRVVGQLGEGGFGRVFEAVDESDISLGRAAVKLLHPNISPSERNAFLGEVKKIAGLRHPNLVGYLDSGQQTIADEIHPYLVTELCIGSLSDHVQNKPGNRLSAAESLQILVDVSAGLHHLHSRSLIHRDIKPGNVLYAEGNWKLADFGLMRDLTATGTYHRSSQLVGTPMFMAPELFSTMTATSPSDVYALGVLAHMISAGRPLHTGTGPALVHQITNNPPDLDPALPAGLRNLITRSADLDPARRPSAKEFNELAVAARAEVAASTQAVEPTAPNPGQPLAHYPPPVSPTASRPAGDPAALAHPPTVASAPIASAPVGPGTAPLGAAPSGAPPPNAVPPNAAPPNAAPPLYEQTAVASGPIGGGPSHPVSEPVPSGGRNPLVGVLAIVSVVALAVIGGLVYLLLSGSDDPGTDVAATGTDGTATTVANTTAAADSEGDDGNASDAAPSGDDGGATVSDGATGQVDTAPTVDAQAVDSAGGGAVDLSAPVLIDGEIAIAFDSHAFTFDAVAGEQISVEVVGLNGECSVLNRWDVTFSVVGSDSTPIDEVHDNPSCPEALGPWTIPDAGTYSFLVSGADGSTSRPPTGSYSIRLGKLGNLDTPVDLSEPLLIDGGINVAFDRQTFSFDAAAGQRVSAQIHMVNGECTVLTKWDFEIGIVDASGGVVGEPIDNISCSDAYGPWTLPSDGRYSFVVAGLEGSTTRPPTGTFQLTLARLSN